MKREELEKKIIKQHSELKLTNLRNFSKAHLEEWVNTDKVTVSTQVLVKIFSERNQRAEINQKLNNENVGLTAKIASFTNNLTNWSKSEILQKFKNLFGVVTKVDDKVLQEIGAVSKESVREDLEKADKMLDDAINIVEKYREKYGNLK